MCDTLGSPSHAPPLPCAQAVDDHSGSLRCSVANAGQDLRLGANEAPPAIISVYLGDALQNVVDAVRGGTSDRGRSFSCGRLAFSWSSC